MYLKVFWGFLRFLGIFILLTWLTRLAGLRLSSCELWEFTFFISAFWGAGQGILMGSLLCYHFSWSSNQFLSQSRHWKGCCFVCLKVQSSLCLLDGCFGRLVAGVDTMDWLVNFCHAFSCYSLDSTTRLGFDMLHAMLVQMGLVKTIISISVIITSSHHEVNFKMSLHKHVIFQPNC